MSSSRVASTIAKCSFRRIATTRPPASSSAGISPRPTWTSSTAPFPQRRYLSYTSTRRDDSNNQSTAASQENGASSPTEVAPIPWYLQVNRPLTQTSTPLSDRAVIPDLPPNPPPLLQTLLEHVSVTLGLDDLALFDLRHLDPPPALGSKLIMIIGTARSEKHLHVSADRFCRWLRREHHLRANAAGLLGRNELKIKLRRKAKRMRLLANVGAQDTGAAIDDGIRTGWICVTLGKIEAHPEDTAVPGMEVEDFVGFREVSTGVNVVVQMFTEEKRADINLERLWGGVLKTHEREQMKADERIEEEMEELEQYRQANVETITASEIPTPRPIIPHRPSDTFPPASPATLRSR